jgi:hypothetical protein
MAAKLLRDSKDHATQVAALEDTQKLLKFQEAFERDLADEHFVGMSVNETLSKLIKLGHIKRSQKVQTEFKVSDKTFSWIRLRALVSRRDWKELEELAKGKKSAIGWEVRPNNHHILARLRAYFSQPYFNEILSAANAKLAAVFIPKCTTLSVAERIEMWLKCGLVNKAGEEALKAKDKNALEELRTKASGSQQMDIENMIQRLQKGK